MTTGVCLSPALRAARGATDAMIIIVTVDALAEMINAIEAGELGAVEAMEHLVPA